MKDGGPAFPSGRVTGSDGEVKKWEEYGLSLRDWFAGQALAGLLAHDATGIGSWGYRFDARAERAYVMADAMLAAREKDLTPPGE